MENAMKLRERKRNTIGSRCTCPSFHSPGGVDGGGAKQKMEMARRGRSSRPSIRPCKFHFYSRMCNFLFQPGCFPRECVSTPACLHKEPPLHHRYRTSHQAFHTRQFHPPPDSRTLYLSLVSEYHRLSSPLASPSSPSFGRHLSTRAIGFSCSSHEAPSASSES